MDQIALVESRSMRNSYCKDEHLDVLNRVGQLMTLPKTGFAMTDNVASFYDVPAPTIRTLVKRHKDEFVSDGYKTLTASEFREFHNETLKVNVKLIAMFPKRAVLRVGMLLRDSLVAKEVRTQLLNTILKPEIVTQNMLPQEKAKRIFSAQLDIANLLEIPKHIGQIEACKYVRNETGIDYSPLLLQAPAQKNISKSEMMLEPADIGTALGMTGTSQKRGRDINKFLEKIGWQTKINKQWTPTDKGYKYSYSNHWSTSKKSGYNLSWNVEAVKRIYNKEQEPKKC